MLRSNLIGRENRLCYRLIEDVNSNVRYTSRVADANASRQEMQRAQTQLANGAPLTTAGGQQAIQDIKDRAAGADYNATQSGTRAGPSSADIMDQATIGAQGLRTNFNQTTGNIRSDTSKVNTGQIDEAARERLIAAGMTPEQATAKIEENRVAVQGAFNQVGTNSAKSDLDNAYDSIDKKYRDAAERGESIDPAAIAAEKTAAAAKITAENEAADLKRRQELESSMTTPTPEGSNTASQGTEQPTPPPPNPTAAGAGAAFANLPPEYAFLAPYFQQVQDALSQNMADNTALTESTLAGIDKTYGGIDKQLQDMRDGYKESNEAIQQLLEDAKETNDENLAKQEKAERERLAWSELQQGRQIEKQKRGAHEAMVAQIALSGGFGQDASLREVAESDAEFESRMDDLKINFTYARTDLAAKYSGLYAENNNNYITKTTENVKELQASMERIGMQGISNATARQQAEQGAMEGYVTRQSTLRSDLAKSNLDAAWQVRGLIKEDKQAKLDAEDRALSQITKLLNEFPESEVRDMVLELGKSVTSFSVEKMLNAKSNDEIKAARAAAAARANAAAITLAQKSQNAPLVTYDEFMKQKIAEKETASGMSMNQKARDEYINANKDLFDTQFDQYTAPTFQNLTSGNPNVDAATDAYLRGDYSSPKEAAKAYQVNQADVATYSGILRERGAEVGDVRALQPEQAKEMSTLRKTIDDNDVTKKLNVMDSAIPKIGVARESLTGVGDVALLNFYQNGIVDPGLAVRGEDAVLLQKAAALRDKITKDYAESVILKGAFFPDETRAEMERIAKQVYEATQRVYQDKVYAPVVEQAQYSGIGEAYFKYKQRTTVEAKDGSADSYLSTYGY